MRVVFLGTGEIGLPTLRALFADARHDVVGVVTQPDKPVGRKQLITPPPVKKLSLSLGIPVEQPQRIGQPEALSVIEAWRPEVIVVMAYGQILPKALLDLPAIACLNLHASLLPRHRGAAPVQAAIAQGDPRSGITVMYIAEGLDTGDILLQRGLDLAPGETGQSLHDRLAECAPAALTEALELLASGTAPRQAQDQTLATYTTKLTRQDGIIDWSLPAQQLERLIRAYHPWPGTVTFLGEGHNRRRLKIFPPTEASDLAPSAPPGTVHPSKDRQSLFISTGSHTALRLFQLQLEGKRRMPVPQFLHGHPFPLTSPHPPSREGTRN